MKIVYVLRFHWKEEIAMKEVERFELEEIKPGNVRQISQTLASMDPWLKLGYSSEAFSFYLLRTDPALRRFCVTISGAVSGVLTVRYPWLLGPFIELLALFGDLRGKGFGRALIDWVSDEYPSSSNIWVSVSSFNSGARKFYSHLGFEEVAVLKDLIQPGMEEILLRKIQRPRN